MIYAGAGRHMLTFDNKSKFIKVAQIQELILHTIPLGALIWYNNTTDIVYDEDLDLMAKIVFMMSLVFNLGEIVTFYFFKVTGDNIELTKELPRRPRTSNYFVRIIGFCSIMLAGVAITIGT